MTDSSPDTDSEPDASSNVDASPDDDDEIDRRRLIRWIAVLAFSVPVVVEALTFGNIIGDEFFGADEEATESDTDSPTEADDAVGVGDELLPETAPTETVTTSEVRQADSGDRTYVLRVDVENGTEAPVELRTRALRLRDEATVDGLSSTGEVPPGESREVTAAWSIPSDAMPAAVECVSVREEETAFEGFVDVKRPAIVG